ncbi:uncharacterized protein LOC9655725 [Selaginella moellendorffii]|uniref:uncharacterized protein LOC9655725 n=1 Tax=Selaginella moellendorffii TaxID=88036 RepID=UPI000D1CFA46|nr:uncharacterized protein LOC9655725 [Selaginella moellendorffii]|eukprot:XP_024538218.1 uncharacterized protein LOC9655725 [Selaginella moellendorffii]
MVAGSRRRASEHLGSSSTSGKRPRYGASSSSSTPTLLGRGGRASSRAANGARASSSVVADDPDFEPGDSECVALPEDSWFGAEEAAAAIVPVVEDADVSAATAAASSSAMPLCSGPPAQAFALSATPLYPNSVRWSEDNLLAVAAGHMVTILNPASLSGPRSFVSVSVKPSFDFGTVNRDELKHHLLMPLTLSRDSRAVVRSIDWSPQGVGSHGGCLLAVATTDYRVKLHSPPMSEYRSEWIELLDVSEMMFEYCMKFEFLETEASFDMMSDGIAFNRAYKRQGQMSPAEDLLQKRRRTSTPEASVLGMEAGNLLNRPPVLWDGQASLASAHMKPLANDGMADDAMKKRGRRGTYSEQLSGSADVEGFDDGKQTKKRKQLRVRDGQLSNLTVTAPQYMTRSSMLASLALAWSSKCSCCDSNSRVFSAVFLSVGTKSGMVGFWRLSTPDVYSVEKVLPLPDVSFIGFLNAHESWVTALDWAAGASTDQVLLATGSSDGSVKLWQGDTRVLMQWQPSALFLPWTLLFQVTGVDSVPVTSLALKYSIEADNILIVVGKGSGSILACELTSAGQCSRRACLPRAHDQAVMGVCWSADKDQIYSCGQDNMLQLWEFADTQLVAVETSLLASEVPATAPDLPASALESFFGVALSPANLSLAMVRGIAAEAVDPMYQSRSQKGIVQLVWVGQDETIVKADCFDDPSAGRSAYTIAASWETKIISAFSHLDRRASFVLWDLLTVLSFLKQLCGGEILGSVFQKWLSNWSFVNTGTVEACCWSTEALKTCLPSLSCRCLQTMIVIFRRIILQDLKLGLLTEGLEAMHNSGSRTQLTSEQQTWLEILWCMEHELRERLMFLALLTALWCKSPQAENAQASVKMEARLPTAFLMSDWILLNSSKVSPQLLQLATEVHKVYNRSGSSSQERCSYCEQTVPLEYLEVGYCRAEGINTRINHRLQRCSASLQISLPGPSWYCTCCGRNAFQQVPEFFFSLMSRVQIERLPSIVVLEPVVSRCPFCGILMQRILPEFFLTPSLV